MRTIILVEGPAGSGKSTLCSQLSTELGIPTVSKSMSIRNPSRVQAAFDSEMIDHYKMTRALGGGDAIVDRAYLSQMVYGILRDEDNDKFGDTDWPPQESWIKWMISDIHRIDEALRHRFSLRYYEPFTLLQVIYTPPVNLIKLRRSYCNREFPWAPERELELYQGFHDCFNSGAVKDSRIQYVNGKGENNENSDVIKAAAELLDWNRSYRGLRG